MVEHRRFELLTPTLPVLCATSCANAPNNVYIITLQMICKGVKSSFFKFLQKNRISAKAVLSRWTSRLLFSYHETYFFSFIPSLQKWRIPMSKPNILWGCERTKSSSAAPFCTKKRDRSLSFCKIADAPRCRCALFFHPLCIAGRCPAAHLPPSPGEITRGHDVHVRLGLRLMKCG